MPDAHGTTRRIVAGVMGASVIAAALAASATQPQTIFDQLNLLDARAALEESRKSELEHRIGEADDALDARWKTADVSSRAAKPIRVEVNRSLASWLGAFRAARRGAVKSPVDREDSERLLRYAASKALPQRLADVDVIRRADDERAAYAAILGQRAGLSVELARVSAVVASAHGGRDSVVASARVDGASADLQVTEQQFSARLEAIPSVDSEFDFHRFKGTLARPMRGAPDFVFGATGTLVRSSGLTWRGKEADVHATGAGEVILAEPLEGWGMVVVIDHGGGYRSTYAHLGRADVRPGDRVERGQVFGVSGVTGSLDGPRFYFDLRKRAVPVDPSPWFVQP